MQEAIAFRNNKAQRIVGILSVPVSSTSLPPIMLLVHGHGSTKNTKNFLALSETLLTKGIATLRIDLPGHGESEGEFGLTTITDAAQTVLCAITYLAGRGFSRIGLLGSSFGGIASIVAATQTGKLALLALKSPVCNYLDKYGTPETSPLVAQWKKQGERDYQHGDKTTPLSFQFYEDAITHNGYALASRITVPVCIVHGSADSIVEPEQSATFAHGLASCTRTVIPGADHRYTDPSHAQAMRDTFVSFIVSHLTA